MYAHNPARTSPARPAGPHASAGLEPDPESLRALGHRIVDDLVDWMGRIGDEPAWQKMPPETRARLSAPLPREPLALEQVYREFQRDVFPYRYGNVHPRFFGWVNGSGLPIAVFADLLASAMNSNVGGFDQAAVLVEERVLLWLREALDFSVDGGGLLTSGGSMANLLGLAAARAARAPFDARRAGLAGNAPLSVYASTETHSSIRKAVELLGIGAQGLRLAPVDGAHRVDVAALAGAIRADRAAGLQPLAIVGNAGTVNTGATDDLAALAELAEREGLWLHVDGAFGALAWLCAEERDALEGLQRADSLAFDLHKWMYLPSDVGCVLVRDPATLERAFAFEAPYLVNLRGGLTGASEHSFKDRGLELTRRFRALKVWFALRAHGLAAFERAIRANLAQARHLASRVEREERLELLAPAPLNVVCFRWRAPGIDGAALDALNEELLVRLQESGVAVPSHTRLGGRFALRVAITNHRTTLQDVELLADEVLRLGDALASRSGAGAAHRNPDSSHSPKS